MSWQVPVGGTRIALGFASVYGASPHPTWLGRLGVGGPIGPHGELGINQRDLYDGALEQNTSAVLHTSTPSGETYLSFGTPSSLRTLHRILFKQVFKLR
jgi:hypothetical protein